MIKKLLCLMVGCLMLTSCQYFQNTEALQEKVMQAAKDAVIKVVNSKIDKKENLSEETKEFLKEVAKNFIDSTFERLKNEYQKLTQEQIEEDLNALVDSQVDAVCGSYLKLHPAEK